MKRSYVISIALILVLLSCLAVYRYVYLPSNSCVQVLVSATDRITGKERVFDNPCSVPFWYKNVRDYNPEPLPMILNGESEDANLLTPVNQDELPPPDPQPTIIKPDVPQTSVAEDIWVTPEQFLDLAISSSESDWKKAVINNFSIKYPPQYKLEQIDGTASIIPAIDIPVDVGSDYPLTLLVQKFNKTTYAPQHPITSYTDSTKISPSVDTISCGGKIYTEEQFEDGGPEMEQRHLRRFTFSDKQNVYELTFSYSSCGYCTGSVEEKLAQDKFKQGNEKLKCEILTTFSIQ